MTKSTGSGGSTVPALQDALAAQHATVHLLEHLGGVVSASEQPDLHLLLRARHRWHRALRDQLVAALRAEGETPVAAAAAYTLPDGAGGAAVRGHGAEAEARCAEAYALLIASTSGDLRATAARALVETARAMVAWGEPASAFPGAPELPDNLLLSR